MYVAHRKYEIIPSPSSFARVARIVRPISRAAANFSSFLSDSGKIEGYTAWKGERTAANYSVPILARVSVPTSFRDTS